LPTVQEPASETYLYGNHINDSDKPRLSMKLNERNIVQTLMGQLENKYVRILAGKYPSNSARIKSFLSKQFSYLPSLRPEIDMLFVDRSGQVNAAEVKFFKKTEMSFKMPFYKGIDQALSLYRYGFDNVALWHFFAPDILMDEINSYGAEAWYFIRNSSQLKLNFSYFKIIDETTALKFQVMQYRDRHRGFSLGKFVDDPQFLIVWRYGNPLLLTGDQFTLKIREALIEFYLGGLQQAHKR
jgi:hypothetical protein